MKLARRYECRWFGQDASVRHLKDIGTPKRKRCVCGGELRIEEGLWGIFVFDPRGRAYRPIDAAATRVSYAAARRLAEMLTDERPDIEDGFVVRWLPANWLTKES